MMSAVLEFMDALKREDTHREVIKHLSDCSKRFTGPFE